MITVTLFAGAAMAVDAVLAADARKAMKRADLTLDYVSRVTGVPMSRLSDQLNGKTPFTAFWRFFTGEMLDTDFRAQFIDIQCERLDRVPVPRQLGDLLARVEELIGVKPMQKMDLPPLTQPITLPLGNLHEHGSRHAQTTSRNCGGGPSGSADVHCGAVHLPIAHAR